MTCHFRKARTSPHLRYMVLKTKALLPRGFIGRFSTKELRFILLHELAHLKRRDILFNWLAAILQIFHWFNPLIWFGFARWRGDRELACDALALETAGVEQNKEYGQTILRLLENFTHRAAVPGIGRNIGRQKTIAMAYSDDCRISSGPKFGLVTAALFAGIGLVCLTDAQNKASLTSKTTSSSETAQIVLQTGVSPRPLVTNGPTMKVTVLDDATGQPLENAEVFVAQ